MKKEVEKQKNEKVKIDMKAKQLEKKAKSGKREEKPNTEKNNNNELEPTYPSLLSASLGSTLELASSPSTTQPASTARNILSPNPTPPLTRVSSPHTPPGPPTCRRSPASAATSIGTCGIPQITEDYTVGVNQIDLGPRVNDLSKM